MSSYFGCRRIRPTDYIKRVIGLPGDKIQVIDGVVSINGTPVKHERADDFIETEEGTHDAPVKRWKDTLPNGVSFYTLDLVDNGFADNTQVYTVPPGQLFHDGRQPGQFDRQPLQPGRHGAVREYRRQGADHLLLRVRGRARLAILALAGVGALEQTVHDRQMSRKAKDRTALEDRIGYKFADKDLLERALTHISALSGGNRAASYQRLEFLGDHVLGLVISDMLYRAFPKANEGELSRRLADLVRKDTCAEVARAMDLGPALKLGNSESHAGGRRRTTILADVCEALVGAVFIDGGYQAADDLIVRFWKERMLKPLGPLRDPKTMLQEWAQARGLPTPAYRELARTGPHHDPEFRVAVVLPDRPPAEGLGSSKRAAEQAAAAAMLTRVGVAADKLDG